MEALKYYFLRKNRCRNILTFFSFCIFIFFTSCEIVSPFSFANSLKSEGFVKTYAKEIDISSYLDDGNAGFIGMAVTTDSLWLLTYKSATELDPVSLALKKKYLFEPALDFVTFNSIASGYNSQLIHVAPSFLGNGRYRFLKVYSNGSGNYNLITIYVNNNGTSSISHMLSVAANTISFPIGNDGAMDYNAMLASVNPAVFNGNPPAQITFNNVFGDDNLVIEGFSTSDVAGMAYYVSQAIVTNTGSTYSCTFKVSLVDRNQFNNSLPLFVDSKELNAQIPIQSYASPIAPLRLKYSYGKGGALVMSQETGNDSVGVAIMDAGGFNQIGSVLFNNLHSTIAGDGAWYAICNLYYSDSDSDSEKKYPCLRRYVWGKP